MSYNKSSLTKNNILKKFFENGEEYTKNEIEIINDYLRSRIEKFENILFKSIVQEIDTFKKKKYPNIQILKNATVVYNKLKDDINSKFLTEPYCVQNLELIQNEYIFEPKTNPFKLLQNDLLVPENYIKDFEGLDCKPLKGLLCFIIVHETKMRKEFSINVIMDNQIYFDKDNIFNYDNYAMTDITEFLQLKNKNLIIDIKNYTKEIHSKNLEYLQTFKKYNSSNLYFGFLATLTFKNTDEEDIYDVLDLLYYHNIDKKPFLNLYYEIYILEKNTKHFIYKDLNENDFKKCDNVFIQKSEKLFYKDLKKCLILHDNKINVILKNMYMTTLKKTSTTLCINEENELIFNFSKNRKNIEIFINAKEIYYNNLDYDNKICLQDKSVYNKNIIYKSNLLEKNVLYNKIKEKYFLSKHFIMNENEKSEKHDLLTALYKINHMTLPWNVLWKYVKDNKFKNYKFDNHESCIALFKEFEIKNKSEYDEIISDLTNISFTKIFEFIFDNTKNKSLLVDFIKKNIIYENKKLIITGDIEQKEFKDYVEILNLILNFI